MITKIQLTERILGQLSMPVDSKNIRKFHNRIWLNPRSAHANSLRLSEYGYYIFAEQLALTKYEISFPEDSEFTNELVLRLDKFLESPYYIQKKSLVVFREKTAVELILYGGDIQKYGKAKFLSFKRTESA
jgi:hypothetical protein